MCCITVYEDSPVIRSSRPTSRRHTPPLDFAISLLIDRDKPRACRAVHVDGAPLANVNQTHQEYPNLSLSRRLSPVLSSSYPSIFQFYISPLFNSITIRLFSENQSIHSFRPFHSDHFYSASSSPLLFRNAPDTARILCRSFSPKRQRQLWVKDLPKVPAWRLELGSNPRPSGWKLSTQPMRHHVPADKTHSGFTKRWIHRTVKNPRYIVAIIIIVCLGNSRHKRI